MSCGAANSPAAKSHPLPSFGATRHGAERVTQVTGWFGICKCFLIDVCHALHSQGRENFFAQKLKQRHAGSSFNDDAGNHVIRVAVLPLAAGFKVERLARSLGTLRARACRPSRCLRFVAMSLPMFVAIVRPCYFWRTCRGGGMADATDLKSVDRKVVRVRLPPSAP